MILNRSSFKRRPALKNRKATRAETNLRYGLMNRGHDPKRKK
ncbi:MAG: hypothetical protein AVDCRST_MAG74-3625 [uncultured Pyrinomonadaceae bacterium]|uniref:Uncharacterized protein n=1 Tax=uncultured Pyrinomonadaceae bacterium TaxID=2283094 RepID=A0A6J4PZE0_9BACT|nr:MAG: hypothetical protein AVDCRST_MAG74-3625 [uncultured Pyrinomonadaceae bacterium]